MMAMAIRTVSCFHVPPSCRQYLVGCFIPSAPTRSTETSMALPDQDEVQDDYADEHIYKSLDLLTDEELMEDADSFGVTSAFDDEEGMAAEESAGPGEGFNDDEDDEDRRKTPPMTWTSI